MRAGHQPCHSGVSGLPGVAAKARCQLGEATTVTGGERRRTVNEVLHIGRIPLTDDHRSAVTDLFGADVTIVYVYAGDETAALTALRRPQGWKALRATGLTPTVRAAVDQMDVPQLQPMYRRRVGLRARQGGFNDTLTHYELVERHQAALPA